MNNLLKISILITISLLMGLQRLLSQSISESGSAITIVSQKNQKLLEVDGALVSGGTKVQTWNSYDQNGLVDGLNQFWYLIPVQISAKSTVYYIMNRSFHKVLDANGPIVDSKKTVIVSDLAASSTAQLWKIQTFPNTAQFAIVNYQDQSLALSVHPTSNDNGAVAFLTTIINNNFSNEQKFYSPQKRNFLTDLDAAYIISPKANLIRCIGITANSQDVNANAVIWDRVSGASNQYYKFTQKQVSGNNWMQFTPLHSRKQMGALPTPNEQNHFLVQSGNNNSPITNWTVVAVAREPDTYFIFSSNGKACAVSNTNNGTQIELKSFQNTDAFKFKLQKILVPLRLTWNATRGDNFSFATEEAYMDATRASYQAVRFECFVFLTQQPNTVPLKLYYKDSCEDNFLTASPAGEQNAISAGYRFVRVEGFVYAAQTLDTIPLRLFFNGQRCDNFVAATAESIQSAIGAQYGEVRVEAYVFPIF